MTTHGGALTPEAFVQKWATAELSERAASHEHFLDLCRLLDQPTPGSDSTGEDYCFEKHVQVVGSASKGSKGQRGFVDVWKRDCFAWEYKAKGKHKTLDDAYRQVYQYRDALQNPPLSVVSDIATIEIRSHFAGFPTSKTVIRLEEVPAKLNELRRIWTQPIYFRPAKDRQKQTQDLANLFGDLADKLIDRFPPSGLSLFDTAGDPVAHFLMKVMFCLFAEDIGLLPNQLFTSLIDQSCYDPDSFVPRCTDLFGKMRKGGYFGSDKIEYFNGGLFDTKPPLALNLSELPILAKAARPDWSGVEPSIFGTLFERILDPKKRAQIGAHYTSREDIKLVIDPVIMTPLRRQWASVQEQIAADLAAHDAETNEKKRDRLAEPIAKTVDAFRQSLGKQRVLDPACGSGNFLYVALQSLLDLDDEVVRFCALHDIWLNPIPHVRPTQLHGIEINPYAAELAQVVIWIGYLQWMTDHRIANPKRPILDKLETVEHRDAILDLTDKKHPKAAKWPEVDFIVGNPPFLGSKVFRQNGLSDDYLKALWSVYDLPRSSDLCCYWFEKAREGLAKFDRQRAGLIATQGIRSGDNREVLERIKRVGDIFLAWPDRDWLLDGAAVHVSIVGFDNGTEPDRIWNGQPIQLINVNLSHGANVTDAETLVENELIGWSVGTQKGGSFDLEFDVARKLLTEPTPNGLSPLKALRPWASGIDTTARNRGKWVIYFDPEQTQPWAAGFGASFEYVFTNVKPFRETVRRQAYRDRWWIHQEARSGLDKILERDSRHVVTPMVTKHRIFAWNGKNVLPDKQLTVFARSDDWFFGTLHSSPHELWARKQGSQLREAESGFRYTPTTCFETFPLPWPPGKEDVHHPAHARISAAAKALNEQRERWLNPPEWIGLIERKIDAADTFEDVPAEARALVRQSAVMAAAAKDARLKKRTLTNLYNERPTWLKLAHEQLDRAVLAAYAAVDPVGGWDEDWAEVWVDSGAGQALPVEHPLRARRVEVDARVLENLLRLNHERAGVAPPSDAAQPSLQHEKPIEDDKTRAALVAYRDGLKAIYGEKLDRVVLFGSRARGTARPDSDADVVVVLNGKFSADQEIERTGGLTADVATRHSLRINRAFMNPTQFKRQQETLRGNILRDGVTI